MTKSALIVLDDESVDLRVFGLVWVDYVLRLVASSGIAHVVVVPDRVPAALGGILDRARGTGLQCILARSTADLADLFHPDETVLLIGGTRLFDEGLLAGMDVAGVEALICARDGTVQSFERIDAEMWWTGLAKVTGARVRAACTAPGDWNVASLLMRAAVQAGVEREIVAAPMVVHAHDPAAVAAFEVASTRSRPARIEGWGSIVVDRAARLLAGLFAHRLAAAATVALTLSAALSIIAVLTAAASFDRRAAFVAGCILLAKGAATFARTGWEAIAASPRRGAALRNVVDGAAGVAVVVLTVPHGSTAALALLALVVVASTWLCRRGIATLSSPPRWWCDVAGQALVIGMVTAVAPDLLAAALVAAAIHATVCLFWLQDRVSELLSLRD